MESLLLTVIATSDVNVIFSLFIIFSAAKIAAEIFERLKQPAVIGEILAGIIIGPSLLKYVEFSEVSSALSEIGIILLLFTVGLEVKASALLKVGKRAIIVAILGVIVPFLAGFWLMKIWGYNTIEAFFIGASLVATSVGITARVLASLNKLDTKVSQIILAAAVIDDILGLLVLSVVSSLAKGQINYLELSITALLSIGFVVFTLALGTKIVKKAKPKVEALHINQSFFVFALILCFGFSLLASFTGIAGIIGAFLAGIALSEVSEETDLHKQASAVMEFLLPFFLVGIGLQLKLSTLNNNNTILLAICITFLAIITKVVGCGLPALSLGKIPALQIGVGMIPRGEVGIIVAQIGLSMKVLSDSLYAVVVFMAVISTLVAPPLLTLLFKSHDEVVDESATQVVESKSFSDLQ